MYSVPTSLLFIISSTLSLYGGFLSHGPTPSHRPFSDCSIQNQLSGIPIDEKPPYQISINQYQSQWIWGPYIDQWQSINQYQSSDSLWAISITIKVYFYHNESLWPIYFSSTINITWNIAMFDSVYFMVGFHRLWFPSKNPHTWRRILGRPWSQIVWEPNVAEAQRWRRCFFFGGGFPKGNRQLATKTTKTLMGFIVIDNYMFLWYL